MNEDFTTNENLTETAEQTPASKASGVLSKLDGIKIGDTTAAELVSKIVPLAKKYLILLICAAVALVGGLIALIVYNAPSSVAMRALGRLADDFSERQEVEYLTSLVDGGSMELAFKGDIDGVKAEANAKFYLNAFDNEFMLDLTKLEAKNGDEKIGLTGSMYVSDEKIYIANDEILKGAYGIERGGLEQALKNSMFHPDSESEYALDEETYSMVEQFCKIADSDLPEDMEKDVMATVARYSGKLSSWIKKYAEFETSKQEISLIDGDKKVRVIYIIITPQTVSNIAEEFYDYLKDDKKLRDMVIEYYAEFADILKFSLGEEFDIREAYDEMIEEIGVSIENTIESLEDADEESFMSLCLATPKSSSKILKMWVITGDDVRDIEDEDEIYEAASIDFGSKGLKKTKEIVIKAGDRIKYTINDEEKNITEYKLQIGSEKYSLKLDEKEDKFKLSFTQYGGSETTSIEGNYTSKGGKDSFEFKKLKIDGEVVEGFDYDLIVTFDESDKMPSPEKNITSVFAITEEKLEEIQENAMEWMRASVGEAAPESN